MSLVFDLNSTEYSLSKLVGIEVYLKRVGRFWCHARRNYENTFGMVRDRSEAALGVAVAWSVICPAGRG
jgi:hypothetical protein